MKNILARKHIQAIRPYQAGKPIEEVKKEFGIKEVIKLASNENPLGPSPQALSAIKKVLKKINRYPDSSVSELKKKISSYWKIPVNGVVVGNGSDELIDIIIKAFVEEDEGIVTAKTTFLEYKIIAQVNNRFVLQAPLRGFRYDLSALRRLVNKKTKVIFIANPNNPTGTYVNNKELADFLGSLPRSLVVVLDEAYDTFIDVDDFPNSISYLNRHNLIILKTFSKAYGLAGLRLGYALTNPLLAASMEKVRQPFNVNSLAQIAGIAALDDKDFLACTRKTILAGKRYLYSQLDKLGLSYIPSVANFILVDVRTKAKEIFKRMLKEGVIVREMSEYGLDNFIRVSIGLPAENRRFILALRRILFK